MNVLVKAERKMHAQRSGGKNARLVVLGMGNLRDTGCASDICQDVTSDIFMGFVHFVVVEMLMEIRATQRSEFLFRISHLFLNQLHQFMP